MSDLEVAWTQAMHTQAEKAQQKPAPPMTTGYAFARRTVGAQRGHIWAILQAQPLRVWNYRTLHQETGVEEPRLRHIVSGWAREGLVIISARTKVTQHGHYKAITLARSAS